VPRFILSRVKLLFALLDIDDLASLQSLSVLLKYHSGLEFEDAQSCGQLLVGNSAAGVALAPTIDGRMDHTNYDPGSH
jgi:hypothetical protein